MPTENSQPESSSVSGSQAMESSIVPPQVTSSVTIKLPPYWPSDPALWFSQVEAQFTTRNITSQKTKYAYVVGSLQPEVAQEVRDLLINPPAENPYTQLKKELVKRTSASDQQRLHQLLNAEQLGDRKPTQRFCRMQQLLGDNQLEPSIMKQLFLQHSLPMLNLYWHLPKTIWTWKVWQNWLIKSSKLPLHTVLLRCPPCFPNQPRPPRQIAQHHPPSIVNFGIWFPS